MSLGTLISCAHLSTLRMMKSTPGTLNLGLRWICPTSFLRRGCGLSDHKEFKRAMQSYRIKHEYPLLIGKNKSRKVSYKCENYEWYIYASWDCEENSLLVKTYCKKHTCFRAFHSRMVSARWIVVTWLEVFRRRPKIKSAKIKEGIMSQFQVDICLDKAFRSR